MPEFDEQWLRDTFTQQPQKEVANVERLIDHAVRLSESGAVPEARATLAPLAPLADELVEDNVRLAKIVDSALKMLRKSERLSRMFADAVKALVDVRADLYQAEGEFRQAARLLQSVDVSTCELTPAQQLLHVLRATQFFLAAEDFAGATMTLKQAQRLINKVPESEAAVHVLFASCYARVADNERRFLDAALRYMSLSQYDSSIVPQQDALDSLERAITCTILAKAGPRRDRVLAMLVRDDRASKLANSNMLFAVHHGRIIQPEETQKFEKMLQVHQLATLSDGRTVLDKAVQEHNLLAASRVYRSMRFKDMARVLSIDERRAEEIARGLVVEGRLSARIDQVDAMIDFVDAKQGYSTASTPPCVGYVLCVCV
ncbi:MAG: hypothetical protein MHM6MM_001411 [Cercozoa sp. M6MM]